MVSEHEASVIHLCSRCANMAIIKAEENDPTDDDDDDDDSTDADSTSNGKTDRNSKLSVESGTSRPHHKCSRKPTVRHRCLFQIFVGSRKS